MKTLYRGAEGGIIILNAAVAAADGAVARANDLINNSPLNTLVNGALRRSCPVTCRRDACFHGIAMKLKSALIAACVTTIFCSRSCLQRAYSLHVVAPKPCLHADNAGANATGNGTDSTTRLMSQLAEGASAAADVAAALPPSTRASASSLVQSAVKLASSFSPGAGGRQQARGSWFKTLWMVQQFCNGGFKQCMLCAALQVMRSAAESKALGLRVLSSHAPVQGGSQQGASGAGYQGQAFQAGGGGGTGYAQGTPAAAGYQQSAYQVGQQGGYQAPAPPSGGSSLLSDAQKLLSRLQPRQADGTAGPDRGLAERDGAGAAGPVQGRGLSPGRALAEGAAAPAGGSATQNTVLALAGAASNAWNRLSRVPGASASTKPLTLRARSMSLKRDNLRCAAPRISAHPCNAWSLKPADS